MTLKTKSMITKIDIKDASIAEAVRSQMATATVGNKGLLPGGIMGTINNASSVLICESNNFVITSSFFLGISSTTGGMPGLYYIGVNRLLGMTIPSIHVRVLSGSYNIKIKAKMVDSTNVCRIYAERINFTPVISAIILNNIGIALKMEAADNSAFEGGFEATVE